MDVPRDKSGPNKVSLYDPLDAENHGTSIYMFYKITVLEKLIGFTNLIIIMFKGLEKLIGSTDLIIIMFKVHPSSLYTTYLGSSS